MDAKSNSQASFDRQAATYDVDRNGSHARKAYKPILTEILAQNYSSLLDVGAGTGEMLRMLINARPEARYAGIDLAENMLKVAGEKLGKSADLLQGDAESLPLPAIRSTSSFATTRSTITPTRQQPSPSSNGCSTRAGCCSSATTA